MRKITFFLAMLFLTTLSFGQIVLTPLWEFSVAKGNLGTAVDDVKNGIAVSEDGTKLFLSTRAADANQVAVYDATTGVRTGYLPGLVGFASNYAGDVAVDGNGAIYASNVIISATGALKVAKWDSETATPSLFISTTAHSGDNTNRIGYGMDVRVDESGNGFLIMQKGGTATFLIWVIEANVPKSQNPLIVNATGSAITDAYARISIVDDTHFWVDGNVSLPTYCTLTLNPDELPLVSAQRIGTRSDINVGVGGATEFTLAGKRYGVFAGNNHSTTLAFQPAHHAVLQELEATGVTTVGSVIEKLPEGGLGGTTDATHFVETVVHVSENEATLFLLGGTNGIAAFKVQLPTKTFTVTVPQGTEKVYIVGSFTGKNWNIDAPLELTPTANEHEFSGTFACADGVEYKYLNHPGDWDFQEAGDLGLIAWSPTNDVKPSEHANRTYKAADVVGNWVAQPQIKLNASFNPAAGVPTTLFVKGSWDDWATPIELTAVSGRSSISGLNRAPSASTEVAYSGTIGDGTGKIYSNVAYKYYTTDLADPNWEANADGTSRDDRWSIFPLMNDEIARFVTNVLTRVNQVKMDVKVLRTPSGISVQFDGTADIELYGINGQLIDKTRISNHYEKDLDKGNYIIRVNGTSHKFVR